MISNITAVSQTRTNTPSFGNCMISEPIRRLKVLGKSSDFVLVPREATNKETKAALEDIGQLLKRPFEWVKRRHFVVDDESVVDIKTQEGDLLTLSQYMGNNKLERTVYGNQRAIEEVKIDEVDGELSVSNTSLLRRVVKELLEMVKDTPIEEIK